MPAPKSPHPAAEPHPAPAPQAAKPAPPQTTFATKAEAEAYTLSAMTLPGRLFGVLADLGVEAMAVKHLRDDFVSRAATTCDPVEQVLLDQILLLHHRLAKLHLQACSATSPEAVKIYNAACARLSGELRRMVLALRTYRSPVSTRAVTFVKMQAVAERQDVRFVDGGNSEEKILLARSELADNDRLNDPNMADDDDVDSQTQVTRPRRGRTAQRLQAAGLD